MGAAVGMCILLQKVEMYATEDDGGQATFSISRVMQMIVLRGSDLSCTGVRALATEGYWQTIKSDFQAVIANKDSLLKPVIIIHQQIVFTTTSSNTFVAMVFVSPIVSINLP